MPDPSLVNTPDTSPPAPPIDEAQRLDALDRLALLDTEPEIAFDDLVQLAATLCDVPIALISLVDRDRQWFKARVGLNATETHRDLAFCAHAILHPDALMIVENAAEDPRFCHNPLVTGDPHIRFYAGAPLLSPDGHALGTLCVIGREPRSIDIDGPHTPFTEQQQQGLLALARQAAALIQLRELSINRARQTLALRRKISDALAEEPDASGGVYSRLRHEQRVSAVGQLASGIAHDFNNLLQTVSTSLQLVLRKADHPEHVKRWANSGMVAVEHGASLVSQLLAFSRSAKEDDDAEAQQPVCFIDATIERVQDLLARVLGPEIRLTFALNAGTACIDCSPTQIEAALMNLVINARDAMRNVGAIRVTTMRTRIDTPPQTASNDASVSDGAAACSLSASVFENATPAATAPFAPEGAAAEPPLTPGDYVMLVVSDTGPGMPEDVAARAFEPFFTTKPANKGTGLGLAQVQAAALKAGGTARIDTSARTGTTITLWLRIGATDDVAATEPAPIAASIAPPVGRAANCAAAAVSMPALLPSKTDLAGGATLSRPTVLLVDDQDALRIAVAALLEEAGFRVVHASNGLTALQRIDEAVPDIVVSDCAMHGFNGALLGRVLGATHPRLPVLFVTGHIDLDLVRADLPVEAVLLRKPIVVDHLVAHIDAALRAHPDGQRFAGF
ncbi:response regulator [Robbsia sp. KACC 23696]|uniref:response regulator n=1 Tax=Robbsia sp. KACC 23696 TaxID=3149231 RepID=UPI00325BBC23